MRNPLVQYLVGAGVLCIGLIVLLSSAEIARGLGAFWERWTGRRSRTAVSKTDITSPFYRTRVIIWRLLGALIVADGLIWLALATSEVFHFLPRPRP